MEEFEKSKKPEYYLSESKFSMFIHGCIFGTILTIGTLALSQYIPEFYLQKNQKILIQDHYKIIFTDINGISDTLDCTIKKM